MARRIGGLETLALDFGVEGWRALGWLSGGAIRTNAASSGVPSRGASTAGAGRRAGYPWRGSGSGKPSWVASAFSRS